MPIEKLKKILADFDNSKATELEYEDADFKVVIKKAAHETDCKEDDCSDESIMSPLVGTYYDASPAVCVGEKVKKGQTLCIIESMKIMNKICASADLIVKKACFSNGDDVEYDSRLFEVDYI